MEKKNCEFCDEFNEIKKIDDSFKKDGFYYKYKCAIISETYYEKHCRGNTTYRGMELNYCPMCGKRLKTI